MIGGDESDDDDEIDTEWVPSNCELDKQETDKNTATEGFLVDFYGWLIDVDGGYRSTKMAQQYKSQVQCHQKVETKRNCYQTSSP